MGNFFYFFENLDQSHPYNLYLHNKVPPEGHDHVFLCFKFFHIVNILRRRHFSRRLLNLQLVSPLRKLATVREGYEPLENTVRRTMRPVDSTHI